MKNLKRYDLKLGFDGDNNAYAQMMLRKYGRYVKFFDGEEISKTSINKLKAAIALVIIHYKSEKKHGANTMKINDVIKDFQLLADID